MVMQEELNQFVTNDVWNLVPPPKNQTVIGTKWVFNNKLDENGVVSRNKARLVVQGYNKQEGIDFDKTYAPVARLESIRILLAYACANDFKLSQIDVKSAFLNGFINEEVYVLQPPSFVDFKKPNHVYKLKKALYDLKLAPTTWYDRLKAFLLVKKLQSENEHLKSKVIDFTMVQNLQVQVEELKSVNERLNSLVGELYKTRELAEATLRERDEMISAKCKKMRLLEEQFEPFY
nr:copia protein [Tanacetum cinerariifolium]